MRVAPSTLVDRYPSRQGGRAGIHPRQDPVVWGSADGPLDAVALDRYERDGFLSIPGLLDDATVERCLSAVDDLARDPSRLDEGAAILEPGGTGLRSLFAVHRSSTVFAELAADPRIADIARQLLGSDVYIHQSRINLKPGFEGNGFAWHSDFETWHVEDGMPAPRAVSCSIALTENRTWNGPLLVIAGSHRWFVACEGVTPPDHHLVSLRAQEYGVPDRDSLRWLVDQGEIHEFTGAAGSVMFFDCNTMHASTGNITPLGRTSAFLVYNSVDNELVDPFGAEAPRPEHIATRKLRG